MSDDSAALPVDDPDFEYFTEGFDAEARCKHCGAVIEAAEADAHRVVCPARKKKRSGQT